MASALVCTTLPKTTLSISSGLTPDCLMAALAAWTPRSVAVTSFRAPPYVPNGVRLAERKTISVGMGFMLWLPSGGGKITRSQAGCETAIRSVHGRDPHALRGRSARPYGRAGRGAARRGRGRRLGQLHGRFHARSGPRLLAGDWGRKRGG